MYRLQCNGEDGATSHNPSRNTFVKSRSAQLIDELFNNRHNVSSCTSSLLQLAKEEVEKLPKPKCKTWYEISLEKSSRPTADHIDPKNSNSPMLVQPKTLQESVVNQIENHWTNDDTSNNDLKLGKIGEKIASPATSDYSSDSGFTDEQLRSKLSQHVSSMPITRNVQQSRTCWNQGEFEHGVSHQSRTSEVFLANGSLGKESSYHHNLVNLTAQSLSCEDSQSYSELPNDFLPTDVPVMNTQMNKDSTHNYRKDLHLNNIEDHKLKSRIPSLPPNGDHSQPWVGSSNLDSLGEGLTNTGSDSHPTQNTCTENIDNPAIHNSYINPGIVPNQYEERFLSLHNDDSRSSLTDSRECPPQGNMSTTNSEQTQFNYNIDLKNASPSIDVPEAIKSMQFLADNQSCLVSKSELGHKVLQLHCIAEPSNLENPGDSNRSQKFTKQLTKDGRYSKNKQLSETATFPSICCKPELKTNSHLEETFPVPRNEATPRTELSALSLKITDQPGIDATKVDTFSFGDAFLYQDSWYSSKSEVANVKTVLKNNSSQATVLRLSSLKNEKLENAPGFKQGCCKCGKLPDKCNCECTSLTNIGFCSNDENMKQLLKSSSPNFKNFVKMDFTPTVFSQTSVLGPTNIVNCSGESSASLQEGCSASQPSEVSPALTSCAAANQLQPQQCPDLADAAANLLALELLLSDTAASIYSSGEQDESSLDKEATSTEQTSKSTASSSPNCSSVETLSSSYFKESEVSALEPSGIDYTKEENPFLNSFCASRSDHNTEMQQSEASVECTNTAGEKSSTVESNNKPACLPQQAEGLPTLDVGERGERLLKSLHILTVDSTKMPSPIQADSSPACNRELLLSAAAENETLDKAVSSEQAQRLSFKQLYSDLEISDDSDEDSADEGSSCMGSRKDSDAISNKTQSTNDQATQALGKREGDHDGEIESASQDNMLKDERDENPNKGENTEHHDISEAGSSVEKDASSSVLNVLVSPDLLMNVSLNTISACLNSSCSQSSIGDCCEQNNDSSESDAAEHMPPHGQKCVSSDESSRCSNNVLPDSGVSSCSSRTSPVADMQEMLFEASSISMSLLTGKCNDRQSQQRPVLFKKSFWTDVDHNTLSSPLLDLPEQPVLSSPQKCNELQVCGSEREVPAKSQIFYSVFKASSNGKETLSSAETLAKGNENRPPAKTNEIKLQQSNMTPKARAHLSKPKLNSFQNSILDLMCTRTKRGRKRNYSIITGEGQNTVAGTSRDATTHYRNELMASETETDIFSATRSPTLGLIDKNLAKLAPQLIATIDGRGENMKKIDAIKKSSDCTRSLADTSKVIGNMRAVVNVTRDAPDNLHGRIGKAFDLASKEVMDITSPKLDVSSHTTDCMQGFVEKRLDQGIIMAHEKNYPKLDGCRDTTNCTEVSVEKRLDLKASEMREDKCEKSEAIRADSSNVSTASNLDLEPSFRPVIVKNDLPEGFECTAAKSFEDSATDHSHIRNEPCQISTVLPKLSEECFPKFRYTFAPVITNSVEKKISITKDNIMEGSSNRNSDSNENKLGTATALKPSDGELTQSHCYNEQASSFSLKTNMNDNMDGHTNNNPMNLSTSQASDVVTLLSEERGRPRPVSPNVFKTLPRCVPTTAAKDTSLAFNSDSLTTLSYDSPQISCNSSSIDSLVPYSTTEQILPALPSNSRSLTGDKVVHLERMSVNERKRSQATPVYQTEMYDIMCSRNKRGRKKQIMKMPVELHVDNTLQDEAMGKDILPIENEAVRQNVDVNSDADMARAEQQEAKYITNISQVGESDNICDSQKREKVEIKCDGDLNDPIQTSKENGFITKFIKNSDGGIVKEDTFEINHSKVFASSTQFSQSAFPTSDFESSKSTPTMAIQCQLQNKMLTLPGVHKPNGAASSSGNSTGAEAQEAASHLGNQTVAPRPSITKPDGNEGSGGNYETRTLSAGQVSAKRTKTEACVVTDSKTVLYEKDENGLELDSKRELKRYSYGLRARHKISYAEHSPKWESRSQDIALTKKTCPTSKLEPNFKPKYKKICSSKAGLKHGRGGSQLYSDSDRVFGSSDFTVLTSSHGSSSDNSGTVEDQTMKSKYTDKSPETDRQDMSAIPAFGVKESSGESARTTNIFKNSSTRVQSKFLAPKLVRLQLEGTERMPVPPTSPSTRHPVLSTTTSKEQPAFSTIASIRVPALSVASNKLQPVLSTPSNKEKPSLSTIVSLEQTAHSTTSNTEQSILPKTLITDQTVIDIPSHHEQAYIANTQSTEQSTFSSCPEPGALALLSSTERPARLTSSNNKLSIPSAKLEQTAYIASSNEEKAVLSIFLNHEQSSLSSTSNKEDRNCIPSSNVPSRSSASNDEQPAPHVTPSKEELTFSGNPQTSLLSSDQKRGDPASLKIHTTTSTLSSSSHIRSSPRKTSSNYYDSNPETLFATKADQSQTNDMLIQSQVLQPLIYGKGNQTLSSLPSQYKLDSVNDLTDNTLVFNPTIKPESNSGSESTKVVNIFSNSHFTHLGSIPSQAPTHSCSCDDVMDILLPKGYAIVKLDDQGEPCDVVQSILAKIRSRLRKDCSYRDDDAGAHRPEQSEEFFSRGSSNGSFSENVTSPCVLRTSLNSSQTGCNNERSNLFNLQSPAVGSHVYSSSTGTVSEFDLTADIPQNPLADSSQSLESPLSTVAGGSDQNGCPNLVTLHDSGSIDNQGFVSRVHQADPQADVPIRESTIDKEVTAGELLRSDASNSEAASEISDDISNETCSNMFAVASGVIPVHGANCDNTLASTANRSTSDTATTDHTDEIATANCSAPEASTANRSTSDTATTDHTNEIATANCSDPEASTANRSTSDTATTDHTNEIATANCSDPEASTANRSTSDTATTDHTNEIATANCSDPEASTANRSTSDTATTDHTDEIATANCSDPEASTANRSTSDTATTDHTDEIATANCSDPEASTANRSTSDTATTDHTDEIATANCSDPEASTANRSTSDTATTDHTNEIATANCSDPEASTANRSTSDTATTDHTDEIATANCIAPEASAAVLTTVDVAANGRSPCNAANDSTSKPAGINSLQRNAANDCTHTNTATDVVGTETVASNSVPQEGAQTRNTEEATGINVHSSDVSIDGIEAIETNDDAASCASFSEGSEDLFMAVVIDSDDSICEFDSSSENARDEEYSTNMRTSTGDTPMASRDLECSTAASKLKACKSTQTAPKDVGKGQNDDTNLRYLMLNLLNRSPVETSTSTKNVKKKSLNEPKKIKGNKVATAAHIRAPRGRKRKCADEDFEDCQKRPTKMAKRKPASCQKKQTKTAKRKPASK